MSRFHPFIRTVGTKALVLAWVLESHTSCTTLVDLETLGCPAIRQGILGRWREGFRGMVWSIQLLPRNLTWNLKMMVSKRNLLFQGLLFRFHVKFQGCTNSRQNMGNSSLKRKGSIKHILKPLVQYAYSSSWSMVSQPILYFLENKRIHPGLGSKSGKISLQIPYSPKRPSICPSRRTALHVVGHHPQRRSTAKTC